MAWTIEFSDRAADQFRRLDKVVAKRIRKFLLERIADADSPRALGLALQGEQFSGLWRYRVGDYRLICEIRDKALVVLVVQIDHRREVYR